MPTQPCSVASSHPNCYAQSRSRDGAAVARRAHNPKVGGSNPPPATKQTPERPESIGALLCCPPAPRPRDPRYTAAVSRSSRATMLSTEQSITFACPVHDVFSFVRDLTNDPKWHTTVLSAARTSDGPVALGTTADIVYKGLGRHEIRAKVVEFEPDRRGVLNGAPLVSGRLPFIDRTRCARMAPTPRPCRIPSPP